MNLRSIVIIIATLLLGFVLGMLTSAQIRYQKLKPVKVFFSDDRFREGIYRVIEPDEVQREKLDEILKKYSKLNRDIQTSFRRQLEDFTSNLWEEMEPILTAEQKERLEEMERRRMEFTRGGKGRPSGDSIHGGNDYRNRPRMPGDSLHFRPQGDSMKMKVPGDSSNRGTH
ncbi:MAG: hypothetical protein IH591_06235 [Bacteroidales bacterium]|nr:hypothetical protein [Bacteroidales bacterium]